MDITKRIDLNLGYNCNLKCRFCYYQTSMASRDKTARKALSTENAKKWIRFFRAKGVLEIDLTGGEPTIRKDIVELISYCREIGYKKVCLITNGVALADRSLCRNMVANGLNDILFSMHGPDSTMHDRQTQTRGSFRALVAGMENMRDLGIKCRSNTVVNALSHIHLERIASLLLQQGIRRMNLILFNPVIEAQRSKAGISVSYQETAPYLKAVLEGYRASFEAMTVRYIPFCLLPGYEKYIANCPQSQYDPYEWDYYLSARYRRNILVWLAATTGGLFFHPSLRHLGELSLASAKREAIMWAIIFRSKVKGPRCKRCRYFNICDGLWRAYAQTKGFHELEPIPGDKISDPAHFMGQSNQFCNGVSDT